MSLAWGINHKSAGGRVRRESEKERYIILILYIIITDNERETKIYGREET